MIAKRKAVEKEPEEKFVGHYVSNGSRNGSKIYEGPRGGLYYRRPKSNEKAYVKSFQVEFI